VKGVSCWTWMTARSAEKRAMQPDSDSEEQDRDILKQVRDAAAKRILFLPHAVNKMNSPDRMITTEDVRSAVSCGIVIEEYPEDARGHSCLMLGWGEQKTVRCTLYLRPSSNTWLSAPRICPVRSNGNPTGRPEGRGRHGMSLL